MRSQSRLGLRWSQAMWECPDWRPSGPGILGKSQTGTGTAGPWVWSGPDQVPIGLGPNFPN